MTKTRLLVFALALSASVSPGVARTDYAPAELLFKFTDTAISESSGFAQSARNDDVYFTHNDSSAPANSLGAFFAVGPDGTTLTTFAVRGTVNIDWEDMATGSGPDGGPFLLFADMGDNNEVRTIVQIYEIAEPRITAGVTEADVIPARVHVLAFEDGPHNAEAFMVDPRDGAFVIVTKDPSGMSGVYLADAPPLAGAPRLLRRVADVRIDQLASAATSSARETTAGDIAPDRSKIVVRTYVEAFEWTLGDDPIATAFARAPTRIPLPVTKQGEAIAYTQNSQDLLISSEGTWAPVHILTGV